MVNEEDHFRIQVFLPGLQLKAAWELANRVDNLIEANVDYALIRTSGTHRLPHQWVRGCAVL